MIRSAKSCINVSDLIALVCVVFFSTNVRSVQYSIESDIDTQLQYNDNIFLTTLPHDSVTSISVVPSMRLVVKESNWEHMLSAKLKSNNYSEPGLDSNDAYLNLSSRYMQELNIYTLSGSYDKASNLNTESSDFGLTGKRVKHNLWSISPQYQRLLTERLIFSLNYSHVEVAYDDVAGTGFVPYGTDSVSSSLLFALTEIDKLSFSLQATDYASDNSVSEYQSYVARIGIEHEFSETLSTNFSIGSSRRNSTNTSTFQGFFINQPIIYTVVSDATDTGFVLDAEISQKLETGALTAAISRNEAANSYGGLNEINAVRFWYSHSLAPLWRYEISTRYEKIDAISISNSTTNRKTLSFEPRLFYRINRDWTANASYRYFQQEFISSSSDNKVPHSNVIYIGMTYNFPDISTF